MHAHGGGCQRWLKLTSLNMQLIELLLEGRSLAFCRLKLGTVWVEGRSPQLLGVDVLEPLLLALHRHDTRRQSLGHPAQASVHGKRHASKHANGHAPTGRSCATDGKEQPSTHGSMVGMSSYTAHNA